MLVTQQPHQQQQEPLLLFSSDTSSSTLAGACSYDLPVIPVAIIFSAALTLLLAILYYWVVPNNHVQLGNLHDVLKDSSEDVAPYPPDFYGQPLQASLAHGKTHYYLLGPENAKDTERIVLIHGITAGWAATPEFVHGLVRKGFRVLLYDLYGRGYSDAPGVKYTEALYVSQVKQLLDRVGWERTNVIGYSLGGAIATSFSAQYPQYVHKVILFAPAGFRTELPFLGKVMQIPFIGELFWYAIGIRILPARATANMNHRLVQTPQVQHSIAVTNLIMRKHPGYPRAYFSTIRYGPVRNMHHRYEAVSELFGDRVMCAWGTTDTVTIFKTDFPQFQELVPKAKMVLIPDEGHSLVVDHPDKLVDDVTNFISA